MKGKIGDCCLSQSGHGTQRHIFYLTRLCWLFFKTCLDEKTFVIYPDFQCKHFRGLPIFPMLPDRNSTGAWIELKSPVRRQSRHHDSQFIYTTEYLTGCNWETLVEPFRLHGSSNFGNSYQGFFADKAILRKAYSGLVSECSNEVRKCAASSFAYTDREASSLLRSGNRRQTQSAFTDPTARNLKPSTLRVAAIHKSLLRDCPHQSNQYSYRY